MFSHTHAQRHETLPEDNDSGSTLSPSAATPNPHEAHFTQSDGNLDEVAAPPPVYDPSEKSTRQEGYLENRRSEDDRNSQLRHWEAEPEPHQETDKSAGKRLFSKVSRTTCIVCYLVVFSLVGTLLRVAIECLTFYPGSPVNTSVLWANVGGSLVMGFLSEDQELFCFEEVEASIPESERQDGARRAAHLTAHKKTIPLYIGLTTGFCGSLTSFSTFIRDVFLALVNDLPVPVGPYADISLYGSAPVGTRAPNGGFSFMALVAVLFTEIGLSLAGLILGAHIAIGLSAWTPSLPQHLLRKILDPVVVAMACLSWATIICLVILLPGHSKQSALWSAEVWRGPVLFSLVFAPVGCLARFFVSLKLNGRIASFPLGTFVVNVGGTMVLGMAYSLQHASISAASLGGGSFIGCQVLQGIMDGFCGCLTTVSTWVLELSDLRRRHAYLYGGLSVAVALCALVAEIGSLKWTHGLVIPSCFAQ
ncbi:Camphor resistance CrcB protein [Penicillium italicum]|uniref:Camphor resistance CrcB protein n=1 Tax=Penicillium italicum TaxID=40296 RepID=A0A0A2KBX4_PENIT|nr:Camphor resistance CrcB protein [Penicillium italicum]